MPDRDALKILVIEDEPAQLELLQYNLQKEGYRTVAATDGEEGLLLAEEQSPCLILLDWMLPGLSGIEVCRQLKRHKLMRDIPVIMLTARGEDNDKVRGLDIGADDYVVKPYSIVELLARVRALIRRNTTGLDGDALEYGDIRLHLEQFKVHRNGIPVKLGPTEFRLLSLFMSRPQRVWTRDQLLQRVWQHDLEIDIRTVDVHVARLRKSLRQKGKVDPIRTIHSTGYSLDMDAV